MLSDEAKTYIGSWRRALLRLKPSLSMSTRNFLARRWLVSGLKLAAKANALHKAAAEMDPRVVTPAAPDYRYRTPKHNDI